ncbi:MAG: hypothetical protein FJZ78_03455 [Bacteroidetes bacterium]|nr:hypothetical protein [Bacteroidota bacterium]
MRILSLLPLAAFLLLSCGSESPDLIQQYEAAWEIDLAPNNVTEKFAASRLLLLDDQSTLVVANGITNQLVGDVTRLTIVSPDGQRTGLSEINSYMGWSILDPSGNYRFLSDSVYIINQNLSLIAKTPLPFIRFGLSAFNSQSLIYLDFFSSQPAITSYDFNGKILWSNPANTMGCGGSYMSIQMDELNAGMLAKAEGIEQDTFRITNFDPRTGNLKWSREYLSEKLFPGTRLIPKPVWTTNYSGVNLFGIDPATRNLFVASVTNAGIGRKLRTELPDISFSYLVTAFKTKDGGFLFGLNGNQQADYFSYRLVKIDRNGNPGWVGTFTNPGDDYLVDMVERADGTVIALSAQGVVTAYKPVY